MRWAPSCIAVRGVTPRCTKLGCKECVFVCTGGWSFLPVVGGEAGLGKCLHLGCHWPQPGMGAASPEEPHTLNPTALYLLPFYFQRPEPFGLNYSDVVELPFCLCFGSVRASLSMCCTFKGRTLHLSAEMRWVCVNSCVLGFSLKTVCSAVVRLINSVLLRFLSSCLEFGNCSCLALCGLNSFKLLETHPPWMGVTEMVIWLLKSHGPLRYVVALLLWREF